jgi:hypothetical protein
MPAHLQQTPNRWEYPTVDELVYLTRRMNDIAKKVGRLVQSYVMGGDEIHLHIRLILGVESHAVCISFVGLRYLSVEGRNLEDWLPASVLEVDGGPPYQQIQAPVFVPIAQDLKDVQGMPGGIDGWYSIERLQRLERCLAARRSVLETPRNGTAGITFPPLVHVLPTYLRKDAIDRELARLVLLIASASNQGGDEIVKRGSGVVDEVAKDKRPSGVDLCERDLKAVLAAVRIEFSADASLRFVVGELLDGIPKTVEMVRRPAPLTFIVPEKIGHDA